MPQKTAQNSPEAKTAVGVKKEKKHGINHPLIYTFTVVILVVIVVTFVGAPVVSKMGGPSKIVFGKYKDKAIEYAPGNYFSRQKDQLAEQIRATGAKDNNIEMQAYQVWRGAFDRTVFHTAIILRAEESGIHVSESKIDEALVRYPAYLEDGEFSEKRYRQTPNSEKFTIRNMTRDGLIFDRYLQDIVDVRSSTKELRFMKSMASPERKFKFVSFSFAQFPDDQVAAYAKANAEKFRRMRLSIITVASGKSDAEKIHRQIVDKTGSFEDLAKAHSKDLFAEKGGDMGSQYFYEMDSVVKNQDDIKRIFALKNGEISQLIEGINGWVTFRCDAAAQEANLADSDTLKSIRTYMSSFERGKIEDYVLEKAKKFRDEVKDGNIDSAAALKGVKVQETGFFPVNYGNSVFLKPVTQSNDALGSASFREVFFSIAFGLKQNEISEPIVLRDNVVLLKLVAEQNADEKNLGYLDAYYPMIMQQFLEENLQNYAMNAKYLKDDFNQVFMQYFIPKEQ